MLTERIRNYYKTLKVLDTQVAPVRTITTDSCAVTNSYHWDFDKQMRSYYFFFQKFGLITE